MLCARRSSRSSLSEASWISVFYENGGLGRGTHLLGRGSEYLSTAPHAHESDCRAYPDLSSRKAVGIKIFVIMETLVDIEKMFGIEEGN